MTDPALRPGDRIGHFTIVGRLGAGGMGEVYRAHDDRLRREVALKVLPSDAAAEPGARARLLREARSVAALNHPHVCTVHDVGEAAGRDFIAMELVEGQALDEVLRQQGVPVPVATRILRARVGASARRTLLLRILFGARFTDLGPFRAVRWEALERLRMRDRGCGWTVEMQARAARAALRCADVPVRHRRRTLGRSKVSGTLRGVLGAGWKIPLTIVRVRLGG